ncbi:hypothetical protein AAVH_22310 [Aphelenchoides avenae]|nr:hypothetical protein AAVH_22310 [Aphelenchus avenae]
MLTEPSVSPPKDARHYANEDDGYEELPLSDEEEQEPVIAAPPETLNSNPLLSRKMLHDVFRYLDRFSLDIVEISSKYLRKTLYALPEPHFRKVESAIVHKNGYLLQARSRKVFLEHEEMKRFLEGLRYTYVSRFHLKYCRPHDNFLHGLMAAAYSVRVEELCFAAVDFEKASTMLLREFLLSFDVLNSLVLDNCILKKHLITDALITSCVAKGVLNIDITQRMDKEVDLDVTDDGMIKYCSSKIHVDGVRRLRLRGVNLEPLFVRDFLKACEKGDIADELDLSVELSSDHLHKLGEFQAQAKRNDRFGTTLSIAELNLTIVMGIRSISIKRSAPKKETA